MAIYTININESTTEGKSILSLLKSLSSISFVQVQSNSIDNRKKAILKEMRQAKKETEALKKNGAKGYSTREIINMI